MPTAVKYLQMIPACLAVTRAALGLWVLGFKRFGLPLATAGQNLTGPVAPLDQGLVLSISRTARILPWSTCLTRSCALTRALRRRGMDARLHIGVARSAADLHAHAWVELDGLAIGSDGAHADQHATFQLGNNGDR